MHASASASCKQQMCVFNVSSGAMHMRCLHDAEADACVVIFFTMVAHHSLRDEEEKNC